MTIILLAVLWVLVVIVQAVRLDAGDVTEFELARKADAGDVDASDELDYVAALPQIETLRFLLVTLCHVLISAVCVVRLGWIQGVLIAIVLLLSSPLGRRLASLASLADSLALRYRVRILTVVHAMMPFLVWLRAREVMVRKQQVFSREEFMDVLQHSPGVLTKDELSHIQHGMVFGAKLVADVMTPRAVVETAAAIDTLGPLVLDELYKTGHSRFPVVDGDIDHVTGVLMLRDLVEHKHASEATVREAMNPKVFYIHEQKPLEHALHAFLRTHHHMFIVVNDYRETVGVLTLEDVLESLLGRKIIDEFDKFDDLRAVAASNPRHNNTPKQKSDI